MTTDEAIAFLQQHQPMPPDDDWSQELADEFLSVCKYLSKHPDLRTVPLMLNCFGNGDGLGLYSEVEVALDRFPVDVVVQHLRKALESSQVSVRRRCLEILPEYADRSLLPQIVRSLRSSDLEEQAWAANALGAIWTPDDRQIVRDVLPAVASKAAQERLGELLAH
jgi:HEAT repeats